MLGVRYESKKVLKASIGKRLAYIETSHFGPEYRPDGDNLVVGPDAYHNRKYFATVTLSGGDIVRAK